MAISSIFIKVLVVILVIGMGKEDIVNSVNRICMCIDVWVYVDNVDVYRFCINGNLAHRIQLWNYAPIFSRLF